VRIEELKELLRKANNDFFNIEANAFDMKNRIAELEAALKPFALGETAIEAGHNAASDDYPLMQVVSCGDLRQARKVLGEKDTPDWDDLRGCAPEATGDLSSEDFVRKLRDEDWR